MKNLGILIFATGNYKYYLEVAIETLNKRFMNDMNKTFYVFTDYPNTSIKSFYNNIAFGDEGGAQAALEWISEAESELESKRY